MCEEWRSVLEDHYEVSTEGRVRRSITRSNGIAGRIRKQETDRDGYHRIKVSVNGRIFGVSVHVLIAHAFIGKKPEGHQINHKDGDKKNNKPENLEYVSPRENIEHSKRNGLVANGERHGNTNLTNRDVYEIRSAAKNGMKNKDIAVKYGTSRHNVAKIVRGGSWKRTLGT